jgi:hypothetical protein
MNGKRKYKHRETEEPNKEREIFFNQRFFLRPYDSSVLLTKGFDGKDLNDQRGLLMHLFFVFFY